MKMECHSCGLKNVGILEMNNIWCTSCGISMKEKPQYVVGFQNQRYQPKQQVYDRLKRFSQWTFKRVDRKDVLKNMRSIMNYFSCYEFVWHVHKELTKRVYFFAKCVMLKVCCKQLGIPIEGLPSLKDLEREADQMEQLERLVKTNAWTVVCRSRLRLVDQIKTRIT